MSKVCLHLCWEAMYFLFADEVFEVCKFFAEFSSSFTVCFAAGWPVLSGENTASNSCAHMSLLSDEAPRFDSCVDLSDTCFACDGVLTPSDAAKQLDINIIDSLMH